ncbi:MAG TPA: hypothetical protein VKC90_03200, partial [Chitinophagaceae bacterium]|nr:hypothetical protein [Chitinophagaceae bacterium]
MNKYLHNIDEIFNSAQRGFEEYPSGDIWDKINADLDKIDAEKNKRKFIAWRKVVAVLLFLLAGFALYEPRIISDHGEKSKGKIATAREKELKKSEDIEANKKLSDNNSNLQSLVSFQKNKVDREISKDFLLSEKYSEIKTPMIDLGDNHVEITSIAKEGIVLNIPGPVRMKKRSGPYWTATGFASNDWAQYKLDNDVADNSGRLPDQRNIIARREKHESSFSAGIITSLQFKRQAGIKTGI